METETDEKTNVGNWLPVAGRFLAVVLFLPAIGLADHLMVRQFGPGSGELILLAILIAVTAAVWNALQRWEQFFAILLGVPMSCQLLRHVFWNSFGRLTGDWVLIALLGIGIAWQCLPRRRSPKHHTAHPSPSMSRREARRQDNKIAKIGLIFMLLSCVAGAVVGLYAVVAPDAGPWWARIGCGLIGVVALLLTFVVWGMMRSAFIWGPQRPRSKGRGHHEKIEGASNSQATPPGTTGSVND
jgi:hypothetical protein